jgi:hypothetical protein
MKKTISVFLALSLVLTLIVPSAFAASTDQETVQQTIQVLGIITGDENGNLNLSGNVTRAQFAKMMIAASVYRDSISSTASLSPFKDVKSTHWAASYIQAAVNAGWLTGYSDGTYRPDNNVKLEEAVSAVLKMLGYTSSDFSGAFPEAQLAKYRALGLDENISKTQGQYLSRQDCMNLFYNLMGTDTTSGSTYAAKLGYSLNDAGELDYSALVLKDMKGPYIVKDTTWTSNLPFASGTATVYRNGTASGISEVSLYDVYYYNTNMRTVWVYRNHVTGVYTAASPSTAAPTSVTVAGSSYSLSTSSAVFALSDLGAYGIGDTVTLLLGMNGDAVGVMSAEAVNTTRYGVVVSTGTQSYTDSSGNLNSSSTVSVACTDGSTYTFPVSSSAFSEGSLVKVAYSGGQTSVSLLSNRAVSGAVNAAAPKLGSYTFADDVQIMDTTENGSYQIIYPSRLAGITISSGSVRYYALDGNGKISILILDDLPGDLYDYGILLSATESSSSSSASGSYKYIINGTSGSYSSNSKSFGMANKIGPVQFEFSGNSIVKMSSLTGVQLSSVNSLYAQSASRQYTIGDGLSVYLYNGSYTLTNLSSVSDTDSYTLYGYYDQSGGRIRLIVATEKTN